MPTIAAILDDKFRQAIRSAYDMDVDPLVGPSQNDKFGDYQANAAMSLAKAVAEKTGQKTNPRQVAEQIKSRLDLGEIATEVSIAGPGFINVRLNPQWLATLLQQAVASPTLGVDKTPNPQTVVVDYSGPNIAKELHVGHLRSTIIGDAAVNILRIQGHRVIPQNHLGDWGTQFGMLITYLTKRGSDIVSPEVVTAQSLGITDLVAFYRAAKQEFDADPAFQDEARQNVVKLQGGDPMALGLWRQLVNTTRAHFQRIYARLGVGLTEADERGESFYNPRLAPTVAELKQKGIATESEGATVIFTDGPDKAPLIIEKTGGGYLYGTTDLAALHFRIFDLHANRIVYFTDARQSQHFAQVFKTARQASWTSHNGGVSLEHAAFGTMLGEDNKPFKTRSGDTVKLKDLLDEAEERALNLVTEKNPDLPEDQRRQIARAVGIGAVKYSDLSKDRTSDYVFTWDRALAMDGNTAPYLQYAHARIRSIFRKAAPGGVASATLSHATHLDSPYELALAKHILRFGEVIDLVARELKPHHLTTYLYELAQKFSAFYENCPVLQSEEPTRSSRLALASIVAQTLAQGLDLLGIEHPEQM